MAPPPSSSTPTTTTTPSKPRHKRSRTTSSAASRPSQQLSKTEVTIHVYDLLPPGRVSNLLWTLGSSLLHSGIVIGGREFAYGGHNRRGLTGVYWTKPGVAPAGSTFRGAFLQGFTFRPASEIAEIVKTVSLEFLGPKYNLLTCNCNHFTSALCERLIGRAAPGWLNRAAGIGVALPCVVPREWIAPPDAETADGELLDEEGEGEEEGQGRYHDDEDEEDDDDDDEGAGESSGMLASDRRRRAREEWRRRRREEQERQRQREREQEDVDADDEDLYSDEEEVVGEGQHQHQQQQQQGQSHTREHSLLGGARLRSSEETPPPRLVALRDTSGRQMPVAERAPVPKKT